MPIAAAFVDARYRSGRLHGSRAAVDGTCIHSADYAYGVRRSPPSVGQFYRTVNAPRVTRQVVRVSEEEYEMPAETIIGYDTSEDMHDLSVLCAAHGSEADGTPIYDGDEWGASELPCCSECGRELSVVLVDGL